MKTKYSELSGSKCLLNLISSKFLHKYNFDVLLYVSVFQFYHILEGFVVRLYIYHNRLNVPRYTIIADNVIGNFENIKIGCNFALLL